MAQGPYEKLQRLKIWPPLDFRKHRPQTHLVFFALPMVSAAVMRGATRANVFWSFSLMRATLELGALLLT